MEMWLLGVYSATLNTSTCELDLLEVSRPSVLATAKEIQNVSLKV